MFCLASLFLGSLLAYALYPLAAGFLAQTAGIPVLPACVVSASGILVLVALGVLILLRRFAKPAEGKPVFMDADGDAPPLDDDETWWEVTRTRILQRLPAEDPTTFANRVWGVAFALTVGVWLGLSGGWVASLVNPPFPSSKAAAASVSDVTSGVASVTSATKGRQSYVRTWFQSEVLPRLDVAPHLALARRVSLLAKAAQELHAAGPVAVKRVVTEPGAIRTFFTQPSIAKALRDPELAQLLDSGQLGPALRHPRLAELLRDDEARLALLVAPLDAMLSEAEAIVRKAKVDAAALAEEQKAADAVARQAEAKQKADEAERQAAEAERKAKQAGASEKLLEEVKALKAAALKAKQKWEAASKAAESLTRKAEQAAKRRAAEEAAAKKKAAAEEAKRIAKLKAEEAARVAKWKSAEARRWKALEEKLKLQEAKRHATWKAEEAKRIKALEDKLKAESAARAAKRKAAAAKAKQDEAAENKALAEARAELEKAKLAAQREREAKRKAEEQAKQEREARRKAEEAKKQTELALAKERERAKRKAAEAAAAKRKAAEDSAAKRKAADAAAKRKAAEDAAAKRKAAEDAAAKRKAAEDAAAKRKAAEDAAAKRKAAAKPKPRTVRKLPPTPAKIHALYAASNRYALRALADLKPGGAFAFRAVVELRSSEGASHKTVTFRLRDAQGRSLKTFERAVRSPAVAGRRTAYVEGRVPPELAPGKYSLEVSVALPSHDPIRKTTPVRVRVAHLLVHEVAISRRPDGTGKLTRVAPGGRVHLRSEYQVQDAVGSASRRVSWQVSNARGEPVAGLSGARRLAGSGAGRFAFRNALEIPQDLRTGTYYLWFTVEAGGKRGEGYLAFEVTRP